MKCSEHILYKVCVENARTSYNRIEKAIFVILIEHERRALNTFLSSQLSKVSLNTENLKWILPVRSIRDLCSLLKLITVVVVCIKGTFIYWSSINFHYRFLQQSKFLIAGLSLKHKASDEKFLGINLSVD